MGSGTLFAGFIKSTDYLPTDHQPTDQRPLTHRPADSPTHRLTESKFTNPLARPYFKDFIIKKYLVCRRQTQLGKCENYNLVYLKLCLSN